MSECIVEVCRIDGLQPHSNADLLEIAIIKGWQCVVPKGQFKPGDLVVYVPIDSVIPVEVSDLWSITQYLSKGRVRQCRLRGEPSFGVVRALDSHSWKEGDDVKEHYGITKFIPPLKVSAGDAAPYHPLFNHSTASYTDVENLRNFPDAFWTCEEVVVTEKVDGTNCRLALIDGELMAGSMEVPRKRPEDLAKSVYWFPFTLPGVEALLRDAASTYGQVVLFGEVYGTGIANGNKNLRYGCQGEIRFAAFDLMFDIVRRRFMDWDPFVALCRKHEVPTAPEMWRGPFSLDKVRELAGGKTLIGGDHIREGVVVKAVIERYPNHPKIDRSILKYISNEYLMDKGITDNHDV